MSKSNEKALLKTANGLVLILGLLVADIPGIVVATAAVSLGVMSEALFIYIRVQPMLRILRDQSTVSSDSLTLNPRTGREITTAPGGAHRVHESF